MKISLFEAMKRVQTKWNHDKSVIGQEVKKGKNGGKFLSVMRKGMTHKGNDINIYFASQNPATDSKYGRIVRSGEKKPTDIIWALCHNGNNGMKFLASYVDGVPKALHPNYWAERIKIEVK